MYVLSLNVNYYLGDIVEGEEEIREPNLTMLTAMFFFLNFLLAIYALRNLGCLPRQVEIGFL